MNLFLLTAECNIVFPSLSSSVATNKEKKPFGNNALFPNWIPFTNGLPFNCYMWLKNRVWGLVCSLEWICLLFECLFGIERLRVIEQAYTILIKHQNSQNQIPEETARELQMNTESCSELSGRRHHHQKSLSQTLHLWLAKDKPKHFTYRIFQKVHWHLIRVPKEISNLEFQENLKITSSNSHFTEEP